MERLGGARKKLAQDIVGRLSDRVLLIRPGRAESVTLCYQSSVCSD